MKTYEQRKVLKRALRTVLALMIVVAAVAFPRTAPADTAKEIDRDVSIALQKLYRTTPAARKLGKIARGVLVFPRIVKGGLIVGGEYGEGALRVNGKTTGYYRTASASYGLQAGAQAFGYALFFIDEKGLEYLKKSEGWEFGAQPELVVVDKGVARSLTTTTAQSGIYAFFFDQKGLMAGVSIEGSKIFEFTPDK